MAVYIRNSGGNELSSVIVWEHNSVRQSLRLVSGGLSFILFPFLVIILIVNDIPFIPTIALCLLFWCVPVFVLIFSAMDVKKVGFTEIGCYIHFVGRKEILTWRDINRMDIKPNWFNKKLAIIKEHITSNQQ